MEAVVVKDLTEKLFDEGVEWPPKSAQYFYPNSVIDKLLTKDEIRAELIRRHGSRMERLDHYTAKIFKKGRKLFIILLLASLERGRPCSIRQLLDEGVTDANLPFHRFVVEDNEFRLCYHGQKCSTELGSKSSPRQMQHSSVPAMSKWSKKLRSDFYRCQWLVLAPVFDVRDARTAHYFEQNRILPFRTCYEQDPRYIRRGGYSQVFPIRIVAEHQKIYKPKRNEVGLPC